MNPEVLPQDTAAAQSLMAAVPTFAALPQAEVVAQMATRFAAHREQAFATAVPIERRLEDAKLALTVAGYPDDDLLNRLRKAIHFARNLPRRKERAA